MSVREIPSKRLDSVSFSTYSCNELRHLSVKELTNPRAFDDLGHPTFGGLYDPHLGPSDRDELCGTCSLRQLHCPGHMGHVTLPLPVFNPLFFPLVQQLLRGSCLKCHHLMAPRWTLRLVVQQLRCLDNGLLGSVRDLTEIAQQVIAQSEADDESLADDIDAKLLEYMTDALKEQASRHVTAQQARHIQDSRRHVIQDFIRHYVASRGRKCALCQTPVREIRPQHNSVILTKASAGPGQGLQTVFLSPQEARNHLRQLMANDGRVLRHIFGVLNVPSSGSDGNSVSAIDQFFLEALPVIPSKFRPISRMGDKTFENPQTANLSKVLSDCHTVQHLLKVIGHATSQGEASAGEQLVKLEDIPRTRDNKKQSENKENIDQSVLSSIPGKTLPEKLQNAWTNLQTHVNCVVDSDLDRLSTEKFPGIKQLLERKEGLFRKHMMGKRVNYAARSVISPDPYINTDEIGIPEVIAKRLTYPQPVTDWNVQQLRRMVMNGPDAHPGAVLVENETGSMTRLSAVNQAHRESVAKCLLTPSNLGNNITGSKKVHRHLQTGDIVLLNRQPTLHKPGIMAHKVRVLPGEKTLRLHYSSCKTYNADFDGDEMNVHFPQNELGRAEALTIASTSHQYLVPKDGTPLGGLIQDHIVSGVRMTIRGRFFTRHEYQQLVFCALTDKDGPVRCVPPCIRKPALLWSGKQLISTIIINTIPDDCKPLNFKGKSKINDKSWSKHKPRIPKGGGSPMEGNSMSEAEVVVRDGELLCGVLDKGNYGPTPFGLVHCIYELYGGQVAGKLLSHFGRLFTTFLQQHTGFTLGPEDIIVTLKADKKRHKILEEAKGCGSEAVAKALGVSDDSKEEEVILTQSYEDAHRKPDGADMKEIDLQMKTKTDLYSNQVSSTCLGSGLLKQFPENNLQLVVLSGAKGSMVNCLQISCLLGQIELEGRRPPLMISGRSLPSFLPYDTTPRAGGFVDGRFLTGIKPQEYFFHCMAGREGLVDTAVKTSRSGYLQRCIIKHLEGLVVNYDLTVRDSDSSVIQFQYGEDGLDIPRTPFLQKQQFSFLLDNEEMGMNARKIDGAPQDDPSRAEKLFRKIKRWQRKHTDQNKTTRRSPFLEFCLKEYSSVLDEVQAEETSIRKAYMKARSKVIKKWRKETDKQRYEKKTSSCPDPVSCQMRPDRQLGAISERLEALIQDYLDSKVPERDGGRDDSMVSKGEESDEEQRLRKLMYTKYQRALCEPGEAVGLLAAQSIGEPSTQMTLNTFHFAGRGDMNVTLGIPRLREILMVASANIKTPSMEAPFQDRGISARRVAKVRRQLTRVNLSQVIEDIDIWESYQFPTAFDHFRVYKIRLSFLPHNEYKDELNATPASILEYIEQVFLKKFLDVVRRKMKDIKKTKFASAKKSRRTVGGEGDSGSHGNKDASSGDAADDTSPVTMKRESVSSDEGSGDDQDAATSKYKQRHQEEQEYEDGEEEGEEEEERKKKAQQENLEEDGDWEEILDSGDEEGESIHGNHNGEEVKMEEEEEEEEMMEEDLLPPSVEESSAAPRRKKKMGVSEKDKEQRIMAVLMISPMIALYDFDAVNQLWCEFTFKLDLTDAKLDMSSLLESLAEDATVHHVPGITRCLVSGHGGLEPRLLTEGVNLQELYKYDKLLNLNRAYTNDIHAMANTYGIEAACRAIIKEVRDVFSVYGITVDPRHLSLIADYMTFEGVYRPFNRIGLESNASPLQKMTFESCMKFLREATIQGAKDNLQSPSARLVVGRVVNGGTGCFDLIQPLM
ncbi:DNA-directed RNA polymerase I subunit RPA1-like [Diadema setosum]|uniref:DNA-directed RNA polymerase I subunit RPA1-like n=1 Tax=Diadema setosum TaxID=31175 RepID=UPI003B3B8B99